MRLIAATHRTFIPQPCCSILQPVIADCNLWTDLDVDSFIRAVCVQLRHLTGDGRTADAKFQRHLFPSRTNQPRLGIDPPPKVLHDPQSEIKRNLRRTPPRIPCRSMWFPHVLVFLAPTPYPQRPRCVALTGLLPNPKSSTALFQIDTRPFRFAPKALSSRS